MFCDCCAPARRGMLARRGFIAGASAAMLAAGRAARADDAVTPAAALAQLMDGNARFAARKLTSFDEDLAMLREQTTEQQRPFAAVLSCVDSRVPVELVFDQSIGHVFVARVAGNICTPEIIASLEFGTEVLGAAVIMVLGHGGCGAVKAAIAGAAVPGQISALYAPLRAAVERAGPDLVATTRANARIQANLLSTSSPVLANRIHAGTLKVTAGYYDLGSGKVALLG
ncbi:MAG: carbonic anhydrase [Alphaproteobacteria bacterium]|nr:carbonic anhydrase [Alphaproteobacteria bacterium]